MEHETRSTCPYCGVGCGVIIQSEGAQIMGVRGDPEHPANYGRLCTKGTTLHLTASNAVTRQTRLLQPMRRAIRGEALKVIGWDTALDLATDRLASTVHAHGPDSIGLYLSGQLLTEDYYVFNKLAKGLLQTNNVDTNSRLCMSSAVAGYKRTLGADAPPACYEDLNHAECLFIAGSNAAFAHPILFRRIEDARSNNPDLKIIVVDPRRTDTAEFADLHLQIRPGTDVALFNGLMHILLQEGLTDPAFIAAHTSGFDALRHTVSNYTPWSVAETCGLSKADLLNAARMFGQSTATLSLYCQGLNQSSSGSDKNAALINLHLATGQIGKPGAGPFSLTGQPNAMGGREVGGLANLLSAHRDLADPVHRAEVAHLWGVPSVPSTPGKSAVEMFEAAADGAIKLLWIVCTNPAQSMPDQAMVRRALQRAEFVIVQEAFATAATCDFADLLLPATGWGEKTGTVTNSERRISRVLPAVAAPGQARHDWQIAVDVARRIERHMGPVSRGGASLFPYDDPESIWNEHRESTRGRDLDITGLSYELIEQAPRHWPFPRGAAEGKARLYEDGVFPTPDGRAHFADVAWRPLAEPCDARYPIALSTGRLRDQWHGMTRTGTVPRLFGHATEPAVELHPDDLAERGLKDGDLAYVTSRRGSIVLPARASNAQAPDQAFIAMHWGEEYLSGQSSTGQRLAGVNALTNPAFCPQSKQPELKHSAVKVLKAELPWSLLGAAWLDAGQALSAREELKRLMENFPFASCVAFSGNADAAGKSPTTSGRTGLLFRAAGHVNADDALLDQIEALLDLTGADTLRYADKKRGQRRVMKLTGANGAARLDGFVLAGDTSAEAWIKALLQGELPAQDYRRQLLAPGAKAPTGIAARGKAICSCFGVTDRAIEQYLTRAAGDDEQRLLSLQQALQCGTNCGSCVPELRRMVCAVRPIAAAA